MFKNGLNHNLWGIILAGGNGRRLQQFTRRLYGDERPKQYCTFTGTRSMLRHTIHRAEQIIQRDNLLTIIGKAHLPYAKNELHDRPMGTVLVQPIDRETAPGILYPLLHICRMNRDSLVAIFPSDHFILEEERFAEYISAAFSVAKTSIRTPILLGVQPDRRETSYGWIEKGEQIRSYKGMSFYRVAKFWEKPENSLTQTLYQNGCLWNTMIIIGYSMTLAQMFLQQTPELYNKLEKIRTNLDSSQEMKETEQIYSRLPTINFSNSILEPNACRFQVLPLEGVHWSDWGDEQRIMSDCKRFGLLTRHEMSIAHDHQPLIESRNPRTEIELEPIQSLY